MTIAVARRVKIAAPALSPVVILLLNAAGSFGAWDPALGSPFEVAPVRLDLGVKASLLRVEPITDNAAI
jgi:hypothetical protein